MDRNGLDGRYRTGASCMSCSRGVSSVAGGAGVVESLVSDKSSASVQTVSRDTTRSFAFTRRDSSSNTELWSDIPE